GAARVVTNELLDKNVAHFRKTARLVKAAGLKLNVWHHSFRELPMEFQAAYGKRLHPDNDFLYAAMAMMLDEFFTKAPEVDGLTLTSLGETRSFNDMPATLSKTERMYKFYQAAWEVCRKHGKDLILRDFGGGESFWEVAKRLPAEIIYMTKYMPSDWEKVVLPLNDRLMPAMGHRFVLEWDLRGEYLGQGFFPYANPRLFWQTLLNVKLFRPEGCVGRIHWTDWKGKQYEWDTVFDVPNGLNVHIFSKGLAATSRYRDGNYVPGFGDTFLPYGWIREWIEENYGKTAWPALYEILRETAGIVEKLASCADRSHSDHSFPSIGNHFTTLVKALCMVAEAGRDYIRQSKENAAVRALELAKKVEKVEIRPASKKKKLIRSLKVMAAFARLHGIWLLFHADTAEWQAAGAGNPKQHARRLDQAMAASLRVTKALGGGLARMIEQRLQRNLPQFKEWILDGSPGSFNKF
ncbi:MAG: hypothetical protein Q8O57_03395, partial [Kiritimatiellota bacterium]|nr:hypothetical protein [Kiritimatiellota bacterium]